LTNRRFKYRREDFGELPVDLHHLTIYLNFKGDTVEARNVLDMTARIECSQLELDAAGLEILEVQWLPASERSAPISLGYEYEKDRNKLRVHLPRPVKPGDRFGLRTFTRCRPSDHILEGIYKDTTPPGAPQQYISQCQQWGFQRIMPIFDDCRAKCTMTTTLEADARYTHLISNGNIDPATNPEGRPVPKPGEPGRQIIAFDNPIPMAPYLFIACAGTWDTLPGEVTYDSGRKVKLEYLVPPGAVEGARIPLEILKEAVLWIRKAQGYEYTGDTYRTICMNKSNFGGMENVGNTTIVTDAALLNEHTLDIGLQYAHAVIVHEFEHNQCGSETTMETPFDVWLNEAYTVDVERQFMADRFNPDYARLQQIESIRNPLLGPLAIEDGGHAGRIVREGFNNPDELIDGVTYVKAAEVIRMLRLVIGAECFKAGKELYFSRYRHSNANTDQFFACFEEKCGRSLERFKKGWLYTLGYPKVTADTEYDPVRRQYRIRFEQQAPPGLDPFHLPIQLALVDRQGGDVQGTARVFELEESTGELVLDGIEKAPAFASMNRDYSFYGTFRWLNASPEVLAMQVRLDPNITARVDAMRQLTDRERIDLLLNPDASVSPKWLALFGEVLADRSLPPAVKAFFLRIDEQPADRDYSTWYPELVCARERMMLAVNKIYRKTLLQEFNRLDTYSAERRKTPRDGIEERMLKHVLLDLIVSDDSADSHRLIVDHFRAATTANDRVAALTALNRSSSPERRPLLEEVYRSWHTHLSGYANYLRIISGGTRPDVFDMIETEKRRPSFQITQPTWCRALFVTMAANNKMIWTDHGIRRLADAVVEVAPVNATTASRMLNTFQHVHKLKQELRAKVVPALEHIVGSVSERVSPTVHGQAEAYLRGA